MNAVIARYLPEFPADPVAAQVQGPASARVPALPSPQTPASQTPASQTPASQTLGDPWAGLARAPRVPAPLPVLDAPDAIRVEPARAPVPPAGSPESLADVWREGLHALVAPSVAKAVANAVAAPAAVPTAAGPSPAAVSPLVKPPAPKRETAEERAALLAEAEERGRQQGLAEARREAETARQLAADEAEARFAEARRHWSAAEAEALADGFSAALRALDATLSDRIARLLVPVLTDALRRQAVAELSGALTRLLAEPQAATVRVSGPEDLLAALAARLGPLATAVSFTPAETAEVQVSADQTVIDTQLGAWTRLIAAAVAET